MVNVESRLEVWKNKLLDLGRRNRLLNYKETSKSTLRITYPDYETLFDSLVRNERPISFPRPPIEDDNPEQENSTGSMIKDEEHVDDYGGIGSLIRTNKKINDLQRVLRGLRNKAKIAIEEQGINILYLCFGFLNWTDDNYTGARTSFTSPLILVPVTLTIESITSPYVITLHEDEIVVNPTLAYKLFSDYGITLPSFDDTIPLDQFFSEVQDLVKEQKWTVSTEVGMSLLSFLKINMYNDLKKHQDTILTNPLVRAIAGDTSALRPIPEEIMAYDFDKNDKPQNVFQIVDADSSQQEAILLAKKGISFILQGPPGTGKSQTITNIIAESLAAGKKVLFVAEKMAALDVVHRRLTAAGLDDFCLVLHSHKTNKRNVLDQLEKVMSLSRRKATLSDEINRKLGNLEYDKQKLNEYAQQVYTNISPLDKTIYEANGIIANLEAYDDMIFSIPNVRSTSRDDYNHHIFLLEQFSKTIGKMTGDFRENPWNGACLPAVTNEFRHDASARKPGLLTAISDAKKAVDDCYAVIHSKFPETIDGMEKTERVFAALEDSEEVPKSWALGCDDRAVEGEIAQGIRVQSQCRNLVKEIEQHYQKLVNVLVLPSAEQFLDEDFQIEQIETVGRMLNYEDPFYRWIHTDLTELRILLSDAKYHYNQFNNTKTSLLQDYEESIFAIDYEDIVKRFKSEYATIFKGFKKSYKDDKKTFLLNSKQIGRKITDAEMRRTLELLQQNAESHNWFREHEAELNKYFGNRVNTNADNFSAVEAQLITVEELRKVAVLLDQLHNITVEYVKNKEELCDCFGNLYNGVATDWPLVQKAWEWALAFRNTIRTEKLGSRFIENVCSSKKFAKACFHQRGIIQEKRIALLKNLQWFEKCFDDPLQFRKTNLDDLFKRAESCLNSLSMLEEWIDYRTSRENCKADGLGEYISVIENDSIPSSDIVPIFKKRFFRLWLDSVLPEYPAVLGFRRKMQEQTIHEFSDLDKTQFTIAKARIKSRLINALPSMDHYTTGIDEISTLKRELAKQRRIMPIRKLFSEIPNLLLTLKPCLMMSPLSVSVFLEAESYKFDVVIFDEASQVYTENAIGAIARGKQVIITGDSKQLPPTNFFQASVSENDYDQDDDEEDIPVFDSVLEEANMLPERTLRWHYRSKHESLIAFSNMTIYKNRLITFPSNLENSKNNGVEYIHVPGGYYDRGGRRGNVIEAKRVAELVFDHIKTRPQRSLGIIAFGEVQQMAIENAISELRLANQQYEEFFSENRDEPFFVKSLENVQGDERDTIIFSIGYAPDASGTFRMNFGPLGKSGGERRLNVAITRAKYNIKLVGSILPADINTEAISTEGPKLLRMYMDYAINGSVVLARELDEEAEESDTSFEDAIYDFLDSKGYRLSTRVGCSEYRIDIGVKHPSLSDAYVLGIECDGASYHSAQTARERDRLRQEILENMGWTIYHIWSSDWIKDPIAEGDKLVEAIEKAITSYNEKKQGLSTQQEEQEEQETSEEYVQLAKKTYEDTVIDYGFTYNKTETNYSFRDMSRGGYGYMNLGDCLLKVINNEYPVHYELLCQRVAGLLGNEKATVKVRREVDSALRRRNDYVRKGDFFLPRTYKEIPVRLPNERRIEHISIEELAKAEYAILRTLVGTTRKALIDETARVYGFSRTGPKINAAMGDAIDWLIRERYIEEIDNKLRTIERR